MEPENMLSFLNAKEGKIVEKINALNFCLLFKLKPSCELGVMSTYAQITFHLDV